MWVCSPLYPQLGGQPAAAVYQLQPLGFTGMCSESGSPGMTAERIGKREAGAFSGAPVVARQVGQIAEEGGPRRLLLEPRMLLSGTGSG